MERSMSLPSLGKLVSQFPPKKFNHNQLFYSSLKEHFNPCPVSQKDGQSSYFYLPPINKDLRLGKAKHASQSCRQAPGWTQVHLTKSPLWPSPVCSDGYRRFSIPKGGGVPSHSPSRYQAEALLNISCKEIHFRHHDNIIPQITKCQGENALLGWWEGPAGKAPCCAPDRPTWQRRALTSCPLSSTCTS